MNQTLAMRCRAILRGLMVIVLLVASCATLAQGVIAADPLTTQMPVSKTQPRVGQSNPQASVSLAVSLKPSDDRALASFLSQLYDPQSAQYHKFLTPQQFTARFFSPTDRTQVVDFLKGKGLSVTDSGVGTLVAASGRAADIERAFNVTFSDYRDADGRVFRAADRTPALPSSVAAKITGIAGFDDSTRPVSRVVKKPVTAAPTPKTLAPHAGTVCPAAVAIGQRYSGYTPDQIATAYNFNAFYGNSYQGQGESVALFELDNYDDANIAAFQSCFGTNATVQRVPVDGGATLGESGGQIEVELDIETVIGLAPQISHVYVYNSPGDINEILRQYQQIANDNLAASVSTSWGFCEEEVNSFFRNAENTIFSQMAAQGQSFFDAIGDSGSQQCLAVSGNTKIVADDIGSQPYVTGVGGTTLTLDATTNAYKSEIVWNDFSLVAGFNNGATGGGISEFWSRPEWQSGPGVINSFSNGKRQSPDVAANADPNTGYVIYTNDPASCPILANDPNATDCFDIIGGTSAGAPLWAAATALTNQFLTAHNAARLGFANPMIYALFRTQTNVFHDVTRGDNCYTDACAAKGGTPGDGAGTYPATTGYDMTTGVGTPDVFMFALDIFTNRPTISGMDVNAGPTQGGTPVTITGSGFSQSMTVQFGSVTVPYTLVDATKIKVVSPMHAAAQVTVSVTSIGVTANAPHTFAFVNPTPTKHATVPIPPHITTPVPTPSVQAAVSTTGTTATIGSATSAHPDGAIVTATPNPAPSRH